MAILLKCFFVFILTSCKLSDVLLASPRPYDFAFIKLGTYRGFTNDSIEYQKTYYLSRYSKSLWAESKAVCKSFDLELATLETLEEARTFLSMADDEKDLKALNVTWLWIDGVTSKGPSKTEWYWTKNGEKISFPIDWSRGQPCCSTQNCLCISKHYKTDKFAFNDGYCTTVLNYICQKVDFFLL